MGDRLAGQRSRCRCKRGSFRLPDFRHCSVRLCSYERFSESFANLKFSLSFHAVSSVMSASLSLFPLSFLHFCLPFISYNYISSLFIHTLDTSLPYSFRILFRYLPCIQQHYTRFISLIRRLFT